MNLDHDFDCVYQGYKFAVRARNARQAALTLAKSRLQKGDQQDSYAIRVSFANSTSAFAIDLHEIDPNVPEPKHIQRKSRAPLTPRVSRSHPVSRYTSEHDDIS